MGFNSVYRVLQEVFPQVDSRMLRAVAIEHSKDTDAAVEAVLVEVIPCLSKQAAPLGPSEIKGPSEALAAGTSDQSDSTIIAEPIPLVLENGETESVHVGDVVESLVLEKHGEEGEYIDGASSSLIIDIGSYDYYDYDHECLKIEVEDVTLMGKSEERIEPTFEDDATTIVAKKEYKHLNVDYEALNQLLEPIAPVSSQLVVTPEMPLEDEEVDIGSYSEVTPQKDTFVIEKENLEDESTMNSVTSSSGPICSTKFQLTDDEEVDIGSYSEVTFQTETFVIEKENLEDESTMNSVISSSGPICSTKFHLTDDEEVDIGSYSEVTFQNDTFVIEKENLEDESTMNSVISSSGPICSTKFKLTNDEEVDIGSYSEVTFVIEKENLEDESTMNSVISSSGPISSTKFLEDKDAKNNKVINSQLVVTPETQLTDDEEVDIGSYSEITFQKDTFVIEKENLEDESTMNSVISSSGPICSTEFLDDMTEDAKNNKVISSQFVVTPETQLTDDEEVDIGSYSEVTSQKDTFAIEMGNLEDESTMNSVISSSGPICSTEFLEDMIEDAKSNKKILVSAMDSVVNLMREVECQEKAAEKAKEEAARGSFDIIAKIDELKQALGLAKEANNMHAGEVYAEKAILATEVKELQLRLLSLSDERDRSLSILYEMREALEMRLVASLKEILAAEQEKREKEGMAREALAYQESQMEKVVEESKILKREAEENTKLQDFLMDRGRAIDMLQGEISVRCQDVKLLKEKFDKRIPLSRSLSSSLASSFRSSLTTPPELELEKHESPKKSCRI